jgi:hypothetical protein
MTMKLGHALSLTIVLTSAAFVVSALAQNDGPARGVRGADNLPADTARVVPDTARVVPDTARVVPDTARVVPDTARVVPDTGSPYHRLGGDPLLPPRLAVPDADPALGTLANEDVALKRRADVLIRQLEAADSDARRNEIKANLDETLSKQFDASQRRYGLRIEALEAQIKRLKDLVRKRQENRAEIISRKLDQIVRESQGLGF